MTRHQRTILLTGASGVLGHALIEELAPSFRIICLRGRRRINDLRVTELEGDVLHPTLGLTAARYASLVDRVDVVLHAAAVTKWTADPQHLLDVNVGGTATMLGVAADARAPLYYVSTAFVARPAPTDERFAGLTAYMQSKVAAEQLVREGEVASVILRPSVVTGDSRDGRMAAFQGLHRMLGAIVRGSLPVLPADLDALVDTVPQDVVAEAIGTLIRRRVTEGELWLTAGDQALTFAEYVDVGAQMSRELGISAHLPRFVPFESVDRLLLPLLEDLLSPSQRQTFVDFLESVWVFQSSDHLPSDLAALGFGDRVTKPALTEAATRSLAFWALAKGLGPTSDELGRAN